MPLEKFYVWAVTAAITISSQAFAQTDLQTLRQSQERFDAVYGYVDDQINHSVYDLNALAETLGDTPEDTARYIQTSIAFRPYWGALKGANGVLIDRTGNALDQSLLAAKILEQKGYSTRIAHAPLDTSDVEELVALAARPIPVAPQTFELTPDVLAVLLNEGGLSPSQIKAAAAESQEAFQTHQTALEDKVGRFEATLDALMGSYVSELNRSPDANEAPAMAAEYFWIEYQDNSGNWTPLMIVPLGNNDVLLAADGYFSSDNVPETLIHSLTISAELEMANGDAEPVALGEMTVGSITDSFGPITLVNRPLLTEEPTNMAAAIGITNTEPQNMRFEIAAGGIYALRLDYDMFGRVSEPDGPGLQNSKTLLDLAGQLDLSLGPKPDTDEGPRVTGLKTSYKLRNSRGLGKPARTMDFKRVVVPHQYHSGARFKEKGFGSPWNANVSIVPYAVTEEFMAHLALKRMLTETRQVAAMMATGRPNGEVRQDPMGIHLSDAYATAMIARDISQKDDAPVTFYVDQMSVIVEEAAGFVDDDIITFTNSIDLMQISERHDATLNTGNGLGWTVAETMRPGLDGARQTDSAFAFLETAALNAGTSVTKIDTMDSARRFGSEIARDLQPELANGLEVFLVSHLTDAAWFSRDPDTGMVIGRLKGGRGSDATETTGLTLNQVEIGLNVFDFFSCLYGSSQAEETSEMVGQAALCAANTAGNFLAMKLPETSLFVIPLQLLMCELQGKPTARCVIEAGFAKSGFFSSFAGPKLGTAGGVIAASGKGLFGAMDLGSQIESSSK